jgi:ABC-type glycerol-3-phosphate transport system permease component
MKHPTSPSTSVSIPPPSRPLRREPFAWLFESLKHAAIWFVLFTAFFPLYLMLVVSMKTNDQFVKNPWLPDPPSQWQWSNWSLAWHTVRDSIATSIVVSTLATLFCLFFATLTAYVIARYRFRGRDLIFYTLMGSMFLPGTAATLVTLFTLLKNLNLVNSLWALILVGTISGQIGCIFILRQFIEDIPKELFESAQVDGAGHLAQIRHVLLPVCTPVLGTLAIMEFFGNWNQLILPLVILRDDQKLTLPVALMRMDGEYVKEWGQLMAGYAIGSVPLLILFALCMRMFVKGLTAGAVKG